MRRGEEGWTITRHFVENNSCCEGEIVVGVKAEQGRHAPVEREGQKESEQIA
jgi:hypothetical protein